MPHRDTLHRDGVCARVHETESNVVAAHEHRHRIVLPHLDGKCREPPRGVLELGFGLVGENRDAVAQVVFTTDGAKWVRVPPRVVRTGLELHPRNFLRDHRSMNAQL